MVNWNKKEFRAWATFAITLITLIVLLIVTFADSAKPQILDVQNCRVQRYDAPANRVNARFDILINNAGTKNCSMTSIDLTWTGGSDTELFVSLPRTIPAGLTEKVAVDVNSTLELKPGQTSAEATVIVKFNTKDVLKKKITFTVKRF